MGWDLPDVGIPNCVPEYFREQQEKYERECELYLQRMERYKANREKMEHAFAAGHPIIPYGGYEACHDCRDADFDTMTFEEDDMGDVICRNPGCPEHKKHRE